MSIGAKCDGHTGDKLERGTPSLLTAGNGSKVVSVEYSRKPEVQKSRKTTFLNVSILNNNFENIACMGQTKHVCKIPATSPLQLAPSRCETWGGGQMERIETWRILAKSQSCSRGVRDGVGGKGRLPHSETTPKRAQEGKV